MMQLLITSFELVNPRPPYPPVWSTLADTWDHPIRAAAMASNARYVVSENTADFPPPQADGRHRYQGIEYIKGADFLTHLAAGTL